MGISVAWNKRKIISGKNRMNTEIVETPSVITDIQSPAMLKKLENDNTYMRERLKSITAKNTYLALLGRSIKEALKTTKKK